MPRRNRNAKGMARGRKRKNKGRTTEYAPLSNGLELHPRKRNLRR